MDMMTEFYNGQLDIQRINYVYVVLLSKKDGIGTVSDYRPISLLNVIYKIITKVFTLKLNPLLDKLIHVSQSGFIPGRFILDVIAAAQ